MSDTKERKSMIKVRGGYSDRNGYNPVCNEIQVDDLDDRTRTIIGNRMFSVCKFFLEGEKRHSYSSYNNSQEQGFCAAILSDVFNQRILIDNGYCYNWRKIFKMIMDVIETAVVNEVLDIVWFICDWFHQTYRNVGDSLYNAMNVLFQKECIGYRFVNGEIIKNIDETEIATIEEASATKFDGCNSHIQKATHYLYDRKNPDYKNSIKESISAVESICIIIAGKGATLGDALKTLGKKHNLNNQLKAAFEKLYSYTNSEGGIRHAEGMFESEVTFEEAKFMLVSCCAFVNYLIAEYGKIEA
ncbi:MAG: hypothetical protein HDR37_10210 [Treponema sp.]|nr:hypothetical protein [Treponema sp.]